MAATIVRVPLCTCPVFPSGHIPGSPVTSSSHSPIPFQLHKEPLRAVQVQPCQLDPCMGGGALRTGQVPSPGVLLSPVASRAGVHVTEGQNRRPLSAVGATVPDLQVRG